MDVDVFGFAWCDAAPNLNSKNTIARLSSQHVSHVPGKIGAPWLLWRILQITPSSPVPAVKKKHKLVSRLLCAVAALWTLMVTEPGNLKTLGDSTEGPYRISGIPAAGTAFHCHFCLRAGRGRVISARGTRRSSIHVFLAPNGRPICSLTAGWVPLLCLVAHLGYLTTPNRSQPAITLSLHPDRKHKN